MTTPTGHLASADHAICKQVLRDRRFGVEPEGAASREPALDRSLLTRNPPDHTRLRRIMAPALSARRLADFTRMLEETVGGLLDDVARGRDVRRDAGARRAPAGRGDQRLLGIRAERTAPSWRRTARRSAVLPRASARCGRPAT